LVASSPSYFGIHDPPFGGAASGEFEQEAC